MSVKKEIFKNIGTYLMAKVKEVEGLPDLKWFDKQMGQFDVPELSYALPLPSVLMEFGEFAWETNVANAQSGQGRIRFYIYFENYSNSFTGATDQELALRFFEFTEAVHKALQGYSIPGLMTALERINDNEDIAQDMVITSIVDYSCTINDASTNRTQKFIDVDPDVEVVYQKTSSRPKPSVNDYKEFLV